MSGTNERYLLNASWLIKLRWVAVVGQLLTIAAVQLILKIEIQMAWALLTVIALTAISNAIFQFVFQRYIWRGPGSESNWRVLPGLLMLMDILSLTTLLFASGGPANPFATFFFVNLSLSAVVLSRSWAWSLNGLAIICFGFLLYSHHELDQLYLGKWMLPIRDTGLPSIQQMGLFVAFGTCSSVIVYFMTRLNHALRAQELDLRIAEQSRSRAEKLEALGTLAAGAAHELASPLSTIAVVAGDVESLLNDTNPGDLKHPELIDEVRLIRSELDRCRKILDNMATDSGQVIGESLQEVTVKELWSSILDSMIPCEQLSFTIEPAAAETRVEVPLHGLSQALRGIVKNAVDANFRNLPIRVIATKVEMESVEFLQLTVKDKGEGMNEQTLERIREPFFTTKPAGKGMGLGVFLAQNIIERIGGAIEFSSTAGIGTTVSIHIPIKQES